MTSPNPKTELTEAVASGNPRRITAAVEKFINYQIWRATGREVPQPYVTSSTTLRSYGD